MFDFAAKHTHGAGTSVAGASRHISLPRSQIEGTTQMSDNETDKPVSLEFMGRRLDAVNNNVNDMRRSVIALQSRFDGMEARFGAMEARFGSMEARFGLLETRLGSLETRFDSMQTRIISVEAGVERIESGLDRLSVMVGRLIDASAPGP
jgi:chromosome segregation ATPase